MYAYVVHAVQVYKKDKMGLPEALNYVLFTNPISANTLQVAKAAANSVTDCIGLKPKKIEVVKMIPSEPLYKLVSATGPFVRLAALSGATAVILGAYGSHRVYPKEAQGQEQKRLFEIASRYHFIHTLALFGLPMCRMPFVAGTFMMSGIVLFCGTCYYYAFTGDKSYSKLTPIGGTCLILGWLGMVI
ncbi:hypothetical protein TSAR_007532 [Trichomalopsis sarcophagae]|uniref:Transmembrane protein 256 homolog n=1 Tax=Trichomalopsis sarcophagae TaxID=543379 RepID=A0A232F5S8_9HYME|nr:hypothetical protein TSAR_007532 [Trichomalopsis sarcophagae]